MGSNKMNQLILLSDIHGEFTELAGKLEKIHNATIIQLGDFGIGFKKWELESKLLNKVNKVCIKNNIKLISFRGNHDSPKFFKERNFIKSNIEFIPDYTYLEFEGKSILCIGGAISIDRSDRIENVSWWNDETLDFRPELVRPVDILLTHSAPAWIGPYSREGIVQHFCGFDLTLWEELKEERRQLGEIFNLAKPKQYFMGHFHRHETIFQGDCKSVILDTFEFHPISF
jgi:predicted phosphodiesterase